MKLANSLLAIRFWIIDDAKMLKRNAILETFALNKTLFFKDLAIVSSDRSMIPRFSSCPASLILFLSPFTAPLPFVPLPPSITFQSLSYESFFLYIYDSLPLRSKFQSLLFFESMYLVFPSFIFLFFFLSFFPKIETRTNYYFNSFNNSSIFPTRAKGTKPSGCSWRQIGKIDREDLS